MTTAALQAAEVQAHAKLMEAYVRRSQGTVTQEDVQCAFSAHCAAYAAAYEQD